MAIEVIYDASVVVNSVDLSDHVRRVTISENTNSVSYEVMGQEGVQVLPGLTTGSIDVEFHHDEAASNVNATLAPLKGITGSTFTVVVKRASGAVSVTNPSYTATCHLGNFEHLSAAAGELSTSTVSFPVSGQIARATA